MPEAKIPHYPTSFQGMMQAGLRGWRRWRHGIINVVMRRRRRWHGVVVCRRRRWGVVVRRCRGRRIVVRRCRRRRIVVCRCRRWRFFRALPIRHTAICMAIAPVPGAIERKGQRSQYIVWHVDVVVAKESGHVRKKLEFQAWLVAQITLQFCNACCSL